jgi:cell division protein FtsB
VRPAIPERKARARWGIKLVTLLALAFGLVLAVLLFCSHRELYRIYHLRHEKIRLDAENHRLAEENQRLARSIDRLHNDPEMIQDLIRRELNFVKKNEIIIQLPSSEEKQPVKAALVPDRPSSGAKGNIDQKRPRPRHRAASGLKKTPP